MTHFHDKLNNNLEVKNLITISFFFIYFFIYYVFANANKFTHKHEYITLLHVNNINRRENNRILQNKKTKIYQTNLLNQ